MAENMMAQAHHHHTYTELLAIAQHFKQKPNEQPGDLTSNTIFNCLCRDRWWVAHKALLAWLLRPGASAGSPSCT